MKQYQKPSVQIEQFLMNQAVSSCDSIMVYDLPYEEQLEVAEQQAPELYEMMMDPGIWESWTEEDKIALWQSMMGGDEVLYKYCIYTMSSNVFQS